MLKRVFLASLLAVIPLESAVADRDYHRRGWDRHDRHHNYRHSKPRTVVSFNFGSYRPYYRPTRVIYTRAPIIYTSTPEVVYINDNNSYPVSNNDGRYCREYTTSARIGGGYQQTYGTACMQPDGSWEIIS